MKMQVAATNVCALCITLLLVFLQSNCQSPSLPTGQSCCFTRNCTKISYPSSEHPYLNSGSEGQQDGVQPQMKESFISMHPLFDSTNLCFFQLSTNCRHKDYLTDCLPCCCETTYIEIRDSVDLLASLSNMTNEEWLVFNGYTPDGYPIRGDSVQVCNSDWSSVVARSP
eukprot:TRINITY_DN1989_c0_g2_i1.p6 TRINITY_DN1989_c0_g2~~TRINITY_DN1989_c0_g2_i1.p6  ORF type:complete len:169 (+),score=0.56 TRINITY_DN1989_c0_g2_i1:217-723(+)